MKQNISSPSPARSKKPAGTSSHASYQEMIKNAILNLKERNGSSRQAIKKYIRANNDLGATTESSFNTHINRALAAGVKNNIFSQPKGPSGPVKLASPKVASGDKSTKKATSKTSSQSGSAADKPKKTVNAKSTTSTKMEKSLAPKKAIGSNIPKDSSSQPTARSALHKKATTGASKVKATIRKTAPKNLEEMA